MKKRMASITPGVEIREGYSENNSLTNNLEPFICTTVRQLQRCERDYTDVLIRSIVTKQFFNAIILFSLKIVLLIS